MTIAPPGRWHILPSLSEVSIPPLLLNGTVTDIVEIDNLNGMEKLTKLQLDNNIITKI